MSYCQPDPLLLAPLSHRLLIVEDNPGDAFLLQDALERAPKVEYAVAHVETLREAAAELAGGGYDLVLLDLGLPDGRGLDSFHAIRAAAANLPIVVVSGNEDPELRSQVLDLGAAGFLGKGLDAPESLERKLQEALASPEVVVERLPSQRPDHHLLSEIWFMPWGG